MKIITLLLLIALSSNTFAAAVYSIGSDRNGNRSVENVDYSYEQRKRRLKREDARRDREAQQRQRLCDRYTRNLAQLRKNGAPGTHSLRRKSEDYLRKVQREETKKLKRKMQEVCY